MIAHRLASLQSRTFAAAVLPVCLFAVPASAARMEASPFADPATYCQSVGTIDAPDARYIGPAVPDWMVRALRKATEAAPGAPDAVSRDAIWRCDAGQVLACIFGANLPCDQHAEVSRTSPAGAVAFCTEQPGAATVPAFATGHATIYQWRCDGTTPAIVRQVAETDRRGFIARIWYPVRPGQ